MKLISIILVLVAGVAFANDCDCERDNGNIACIVGQSPLYLDYELRKCLWFWQDMNCNGTADKMSKYCIDENGLLYLVESENIEENNN